MNFMKEEGENNNNELMSSIGHKTIDIDKVDFNCILHENEMFTGFCKKCLLHFCQKCQEENLHKDHEISLFSEINLIISLDFLLYDDEPLLGISISGMLSLPTLIETGISSFPLMPVMEWNSSNSSGFNLKKICNPSPESDFSV